MASDLYCRCARCHDGMAADLTEAQYRGDMYRAWRIAQKAKDIVFCGVLLSDPIAALTCCSWCLPLHANARLTKRPFPPPTPEPEGGWESEDGG